MKDPLGVSPSKGNQGTTRGKEKIILTSARIEPTTSVLDLPLLCRLSYVFGQRKSGDLGRESRRRDWPVMKTKVSSNREILQIQRTDFCLSTHLC